MPTDDYEELTEQEIRSHWKYGIEVVEDAETGQRTVTLTPARGSATHE